MALWSFALSSACASFDGVSSVMWPVDDGLCSMAGTGVSVEVALFLLFAVMLMVQVQAQESLPRLLRSDFSIRPYMRHLCGDLRRAKEISPLILWD